MHMMFISSFDFFLIWKVCGRLSIKCAIRLWAALELKFVPILSGDQRRWCCNWRGKADFGKVGILGVVFLLLYTTQIHGLVY